MAGDARRRKTRAFGEAMKEKQSIDITQSMTYQSGGYRIILCCKLEERAFFVYGFAKASKANIAQVETREFKKLAKILFAMSDEQLGLLLQHGDFDELPYQGGHNHDEEL